MTLFLLSLLKLSGTACIGYATSVTLFKLVANLFENIFTNLTNYLGKSSDPSFHDARSANDESILWLTLAFKVLEKLVYIEWCMLAFFAVQNRVLSFVGTSEFASSRPHSPSSRTIDSHMRSFSLLFSSPLSKLLRFQLLNWRFLAPAPRIVSPFQKRFELLIFQRYHSEAASLYY